MSAARIPVAFEPTVLPGLRDLSRFPFPLVRGAGAMELPPVVPASRLTDRPALATVRTGIAELDRLTGGMPRGCLSEICGPASSGRTSVLLALMASMTAQGEVCALVDATDSFDPASAAAAGVELRRLLWVRCSQTRPAVGGRRSLPSFELRVSSGATNRKSQMDSLAQALKATDLLLQGGGFGLVVVDLGDVPAAAARRVPLTSWFRFRRAVENTPTVLAVMEQGPYAKTCASVVLKLSAIGSQLSARGRWSVGKGRPNNNEPAHARILSGLEITAEVLRSAAQQKKPVQSARSQWESKTAWAG